MLRAASHLKNYTLHASDGEFGRVRDFLFDDVEWLVRYMVADTRRWLPGRTVLLSPEALASPEWESGSIPVSLTRRQVESSPALEEDEPVSRQHLLALQQHYGWVPYWIDAGPMFASSATRVGAAGPPPTDADPASSDPHLRSVDEVIGYHVAASDGDAGHVEDFILEDADWCVRYLVIDTRNWLPGRKVIVSPRWASDIDWGTRKLTFDLEREWVKKSPVYDPLQPVNREYEEQLYDYYGRPRYWS
jgi:hypothetical protein